MPFVDKSEIKSGSEITGSKLWKRSLQKYIRVGMAACGRSSHGSLEMRGARKTLGKTYRKNQAPSSRQPNNVEASPRQLGEGKVKK